MKVVESTATTIQVEDQEYHAQVQEALREYLATTTDLADHSVRAEHSVKVQREEASVVTDHADHSARATTVREDHSVKEDHSVRVQREEASVVTDHADHSVRAMTVQEDHSARAVHSEKVLKEEASAEREEALATESQADSETLQRRASQREISTISVTRTRAESTR
jgi:hypothetical protein